MKINMEIDITDVTKKLILCHEYGTVANYDIQTAIPSGSPLIVAPDGRRYAIDLATIIREVVIMLDNDEIVIPQPEA